MEQDSQSDAAASELSQVNMFFFCHLYYLLYIGETSRGGCNMAFILACFTSDFTNTPLLGLGGPKCNLTGGLRAK